MHSVLTTTTFFLISLAAPALATQAEFIDLGAFPTGPIPPDAEGFAISADGGAAVGFSESYDPAQSPLVQELAFRWRRAGGLMSLGATPNWLRGAATAISPDGGTVAGRRQELGAGQEPFLWTSEAGQRPFTPAGPGNIVGLTNLGEVVVINASATGGTRWTLAAGPVAMGGVGSSGFPFFLASGVNDDGSVIAGTAFDGNGEYSRAAVWEDGTGTTLLDLPAPWSVGFGRAVSADGATVVGDFVDTSGSQFVVFRWTATSGVTGLGPAGDFVAGSAVAVSADGQTIALNQVRAAVWTPPSGVVDLAQHLTSLGAVLPDNQGFGAQLEVRGVSADGNAFVGVHNVFDSSFNSTVHAWVAYLEPPVMGEIGTTLCQPAVPNSSGVAATLRAHGSIVAVDNEVELEAAQLPVQTSGIIFNSLNQAFIPNPFGSDGNLCLTGAFGRYSVFNSGPSGTFVQALELTATPTPGGPFAVLAGQTWNFQCWYRDLDPTATTNFTDAASVVFQ